MVPTTKKYSLPIEMFPNDVLGEIFRHATWVPYGINPMDLVEKRFQSSYSRDLTKEYRASLVRMSVLSVTHSLNLCSR